MARRISEKVIRSQPQAQLFFAGRGQAPCCKPTITLLLEEWECLRLVDYSGLDQAAAANSLGVSRQTAQALLQSARQKTARALVEGMTIVIQGGAHIIAAPEKVSDNNRSNEMKVAVTCQDNQVFQHFGRTPEFCIYTVEEKKVVKVEKLAAPEEGHGALVSFLKEQDVDTLICGGIGGGAVNHLREAGISIYAGASGDVKEQVDSFLSGQLPQNEDADCGHHGGHAHEHHDHGHGCQDHHHSGGHDCQHGKSHGH